LQQEFSKLENRKGWYEQQDEFKKATFEALDLYVDKVGKLSETKPWLTDEELKDVTDKIDEIRKWFEGQIEKQEGQPKHADPVVKAADVMGKIEKLKKLYTKVSKKKKPKPPKDEKAKDDEKAGEGEEAKEGKDGEKSTEGGAEKEPKKDEAGKDEGAT